MSCLRAAVLVAPWLFAGAVLWQPGEPDEKLKRRAWYVLDEVPDLVLPQGDRAYVATAAAARGTARERHLSEMAIRVLV